MRQAHHSKVLVGRLESGFTLIEVSIVLVVIGLIVGGILVGQNLIAAAAVRAQITQIEKYNTAVNTFKGKYGYLPGDIPNPYPAQFGFATRGSYAGEGDGNGLLEGNFTNASGANNYGDLPFQGEEGMFWVDLSAAHLIDGSFNTATPTTVITTTIPTSAVGLYLPPAKFGSNGYVFVWSGGWQEWFNAASPGDSQNYFEVAAVSGASANYQGMEFSAPLFTPAQAYAIDKKMDDGLPQFGNVIAFDATKGWVGGGSLSNSSFDGLAGVMGFGDYDYGATGGPVTSAANIGLPPDPSCYNGYPMPTLPEQYASQTKAVNGVTCILSFRFQ